MLRTALKPISVIIVVFSGFLAGELITQAADNEGEQSELSEIRAQECTNEQAETWEASSNEQVQKQNCKQ